MRIKNALRQGGIFLLLLGAALQAHAQDEKDVVYGEAGGEQLKLDVFGKADPNGAPKPALIAVHGGGWVGGDKSEFADACRGLADNGFMAFSVNYRLVKENKNKWPAQLDDVQRAVRWIRSNSKKYNLDPNRVGALGASAGGHLVALLGTRDTRDNSDPTLKDYSSRVNCVIDLFGPTDFTIAVNDANASPIALQLVKNFIGKAPEEDPAAYKDASPIAFVDKKTVPTLIYHGTADPLVPLDQSQRFFDRLKQEGIETQFIKGEGEGHSLPQNPETGQKLLTASILFLTLHLVNP